MNTLVVNFFGGPGSGKSIVAADTFAKLKWRGIVAELSNEYVKRKLWEEHVNLFANQIYIFGKQHLTIKTLLGKVRVVVTDSPFIMGCVYDTGNNIHLHKLIIEEFKKLNTYNIFLNRDMSKFETEGRFQSLNQAIEIDTKIKALLRENNIDFTEIQTCPENVEVITQRILEKL